MPLYLLIHLVLLPFTLLGGVWYYGSLLWVRRRTGLSLTAYEVLLQRCLLHFVGARFDSTSVRLMEKLPGCSRLQLALLIGPQIAAARWSGYLPSYLQFPAPLPSTAQTFLAHRTRVLDDAVKLSLDKVSQVVILGAGWDTRGYGMLSNFAGGIFELDFGCQQRMKREALAEAGIDATGVNFVESDLTASNWFDDLLAAGLNPGAPTFFLWEGVSYYLPSAAVEETLATLARQSAPGSLLAFDFPSAELLGSEQRWAQALLALVRLVGEPWRSGIALSGNARSCCQQYLQKFGLWLLHFEGFGQDPDCFGGVALAMNGGSVETEKTPLPE